MLHPQDFGIWKIPRNTLSSAFMANLPRLINRCFIITLLAKATATAAHAASLLLADGQVVEGTPSQTQAATGEPPALVWTEPGGTQRTLAQSAIMEMRLPEATPPKAPAASIALLTLNNGDSLRGELAAMDEATLTLRTSFAGELKVRRDMTSSLRIIQSPRNASTTLGDWVFGSNNSWVTSGTGIATQGKGPATLKFKYPQRFRLGMDIEWKTNPRFQIQFLSNDQADSGYILSVHERYLSLNKRRSRDAGINQAAFVGANASLADLDDRGKVRFEIVGDTATGFIALLVDGRLALQLVDPNPSLDDQEKVLQISPQAPMRVSAVSVATWDGDPASLVAGKAAAETPLSANQLVLRNGDMVTAANIKILAGVAEVESAHGAIKIPVNRLRTVGMPKPAGNPPTPKKMLGDVRAWFVDGGRITFRLDELKDGTLTGYSQQFGTATFQLSAFERIEMNLDNIDLDPKRSQFAW